MAKPELGTKRICGECSAKFYDLNKNPIVCPKCGATFDLSSLVVASAAAKPREKPIKKEVEEEDEIDEAVVPLEDADAEEAETGRAGTDAGIEADDDVPDLDEDALEEDEEDKTDEFLEDEEDDDDVSSLIEGELDDDED